jgi:hypothetical protein
MLYSLVKVRIASEKEEGAPSPLGKGSHQVKCQSDVYRLLDRLFVVLARYGMNDGAATHVGRPKKFLFLQPVQFDSEPRTSRWRILKRVVKGVLFCSRRFRIGIKVIRVLDFLVHRLIEEPALDELPQFHVVELVGSLQRTQHFIAYAPSTNQAALIYFPPIPNTMSDNEKFAETAVFAPRNLHGGLHGYKIVYIGRFARPGKDAKLLKINGRGERIRTSDPLVPNQVLYQAEPLPDNTA